VEFLQPALQVGKSSTICAGRNRLGLKRSQRRVWSATKGGDLMPNISQEVEFVLSMAGILLALVLAYYAFMRTRWAPGR
jgi:hypothetical protein